MLSPEVCGGRSEERLSGRVSLSEDRSSSRSQAHELPSGERHNQNAPPVVALANELGLDHVPVITGQQLICPVVHLLLGIEQHAGLPKRLPRAKR